MKFLVKFLLLGMVAATAIFFWQRNWHSASHPSEPIKLADAPATPARPAHSSPAVIVTLRVDMPSKPYNQFDHTMALLRSKLRQWQESQINDPDDEAGRAQLLQEMLAMVTDANVAEIIQSLSAEEMNTPFGTGALHHWMQVDPIVASNWLASRPGTTEDQTLAVAEDWAGNRDGLQQYIDQLPDTAWKQSFLQDASSAMSFTNPVAAVNLAQQMKPGEAQTNLLRGVVSGWVSTDPNAALDWVAGVKDPALREQLVASAVQSYALTDPALAANWLVQEVKSDGLVKDAALNILQTWVATDPAAAANWASQFPEGDTKAAAVKIVSSYWQQTDPAAAAAWIQNLSGEPATTTN